jgi:hypothetical protein
MNKNISVKTFYETMEIPEDFHIEVGALVTPEILKKLIKYHEEYKQISELTERVSKLQRALEIKNQEIQHLDNFRERINQGFRIPKIGNISSNQFTKEELKLINSQFYKKSCTLMVDIVELIDSAQFFDPRKKEVEDLISLLRQTKELLETFPKDKERRKLFQIACPDDLDIV